MTPLKKVDPKWWDPLFRLGELDNGTHNPYDETYLLVSNEELDLSERQRKTYSSFLNKFRLESWGEGTFTFLLRFDSGQGHRIQFAKPLFPSVCELLLNRARNPTKATVINARAMASVCDQLDLNDLGRQLWEAVAKFK